MDGSGNVGLGGGGYVGMVGVVKNLGILRGPAPGAIAGYGRGGLLGAVGDCGVRWGWLQGRGLEATKYLTLLS